LDLPYYLSSIVLVKILLNKEPHISPVMGKLQPYVLEQCLKLHVPVVSLFHGFELLLQKQFDDVDVVNLQAIFPDDLQVPSLKVENDAIKGLGLIELFN
jgi:hypothetical protein